MTQEFEGKTEKDAIDLAVETLGLQDGEFDVEILENTKKSGIFRRGKVRIRVHYSGEELPQHAPGRVASSAKNPNEEGLEQKLVAYINAVIEKMELTGRGSIVSRDEHKITINIESRNSSVIIGRSGKNIDALQLILNSYATKLGYSRRLVIDSENYRARRDESIVREAKSVAEDVLLTRSSQLLKPMNPFERRLVHTTLNEIPNIKTVSEGVGASRQVRIIYTEA